ncbi:MAG: hypothetical protein R3293_14330, partial [Candidatus Promineifilaceae bacterium]|nr:hypothetical protein [Candidatus Promineifilaceae bacterium]
YEAYGQLIQSAGGGQHRSCLLITSRELPQHLARISSGKGQAGVLHLSGLPDEAGAGILRAHGIAGSDEKLAALVQRYSGNPLALKLVADTAQALFAGDIDLLVQESAVFGDIYDVLDEQFERLTALEEEILTWLAVEREPVGSQIIWDNLAGKPHKREFLEALRSLHFRSLLEQAPLTTGREKASAPRYTLQNVIMEYATSRLIESICRDIETEITGVLQRYALQKAHTREFVQASQRRLLLEPVAHWLVSRLGQAGAVQKLDGLLERMRAEPGLWPGYGGANILHLLHVLGAELNGRDFSRLAIRQADLREVTLHNVSFRGSDLKGTIFRDTFGMVIDLDFSPDGQFLAAAAADRSITLWRLHEYQPYLVIEQSTGYSLSVAFSPDSQMIAAGGLSGAIQLWDVASGEQLETEFAHAGEVTAVVFSPDGKTLFGSSEDQVIAAWDVAGGELLHKIPLANNVSLDMAASHDGSLLAAGGYDGEIYLWETRSGRPVRRMKAGGAKIHSIAFSPDDALLAAAAEDNQVHLWHVHDGQKFMSLSGHTNFVFSVAFHPAGAILASSGADKTIRLWNYRQGRIVRVIPASTNWITCAAFSPDGTILASGGYDRKIHLWHSHNGRLLHTLRGLLKTVNAVAFSPDGMLLAGAYHDRPVLLWDVQAGSSLHAFRGHSGSIRQLAFSPNARTLAVSGDENRVRLWDIQSGELRRTLSVKERFVRTLAFSPDGHLLAAGAGTGYGTLVVWDAHTGSSRFTVPDIRTGLTFHFCFSPDGRILAYSDREHTLRILNVDEGTECCALTDHQAAIEVIRFSADGSLMASLDRDETLILWTITADGSVSRRANYRGSGSNADLWNLVFSPNSELIGFQMEGGHVGIFDVSKGRLRFSVDGALYGAGKLAFSRDSAYLITGSSDGRLHMLNVLTGEHDRALVGHQGIVMSMDSDPAGSRVASGDDNGMIRVWDMLTGTCEKVLAQPGPYEGLDIRGAHGLSSAQTATLKTLGALAWN